MTADERDENFLARWSRLKRAPEPPAQPAPDIEAKAIAKAPAPAEEGKEEIDPADLPSIDSLTADSDFSAFLREGVPDALRRQALRKLWVSDPVIAATDVLDVYNLDYFNMPSFPEGVKTLFRVGHGMLDEAEEAEKEAAKRAAAQAAAPDSQDETPGSPSRNEAEDVASQQPDGVPSAEDSEKAPEA